MYCDFSSKIHFSRILFLVFIHLFFLIDDSPGYTPVYPMIVTNCIERNYKILAGEMVDCSESDKMMKKGSYDLIRLTKCLVVIFHSLFK